MEDYQVLVHFLLPVLCLYDTELIQNNISLSTFHIIQSSLFIKSLLFYSSTKGNRGPVWKLIGCLQEPSSNIWKTSSVHNFYLETWTLRSQHSIIKLTNNNNLYIRWTSPPSLSDVVFVSNVHISVEAFYTHCAC
jgi:hypothetical protein